MKLTKSDKMTAKSFKNDAVWQLENTALHCLKEGQRCKGYYAYRYAVWFRYLGVLLAQRGVDLRLTCQTFGRK